MTVQSQEERIFYSTLVSPTTKHHYQFYLQKYQEMYGYETIGQILSKNAKDIETELINCIMTLKEKGMRNAAISNYIKPIIKFCKVNRVVLNTDIINIINSQLIKG